MNLQKLINLLDDAGLEFHAEDILDALWLASRKQKLTLYRSRVAQPTFEAVTPGATLSSEREVKEQSLPPPIQKALADEQQPSRLPDRKATPVYAHGSPSAADRTVKASPVSVPAGRALANRLAIMRSLRPLRQRWPSHRDQVLDEERTAEATAELRSDRFRDIFPVFQPRQERWFDVDIVCEDDPAVELWDETLRDFSQMLRDTGAFRVVRSWRLRLPHTESRHSDAPNSSILETPAGGRVPSRVLAGGGARRLIFFATHGSSSRWLDGTYARVLAPWVHDCSVALLHLMPRDRWQHTQLSEPHGVCSAERAGSTAAALRVAPFWWSLSFDPGNPSLLPIPVTPLTAGAIAEWAHMQMGRGRRCPVFLIDPSEMPSTKEARSSPARSRDIEKIIGNLREVSPEAFRLAVYLCSSAFTIPVARLIQEVKFGDDADQSRLAELFLSGLIFATVPKGENQDPNTLYYQLLPEARAILIRSLREADSELIASELQKRVSRYIEKISGSPFTFQGLVPDKKGKYDLPAWAQPFAEVALSLLGLPSTENPLELFQGFESTHPPAIIGTAARLAAAGKPLRPNVVAAAVWQAMRQSGLLRQALDGQWVFLPGIEAQLKRLDEHSPLLGVKILWVDDNPKNNSLETQDFTLRGASVKAVLSTKEAIPFLASEDWDLVISDMARRNERRAGLALLREMRTRGIDVPLIIYAGQEEAEHPELALQAGAFGCTNDPRQLYDLVKKAARRPIVDDLQPLSALDLARARLLLLLTTRTTLGVRHEDASSAVPDATWKAILAALISIGFDQERAHEALRDYTNKAHALALELIQTAQNTEMAYRRHLSVVQAFAGSTVNQVILREESNLVVAAHVLAPSAAPGYKIASWDGLIGRAAKTGETVWAPDVSKETEYIAAEHTTKSELVLPVFDQREASFVSAVINIEIPRPNALSSDQIEWLKEFVTPLASQIPARRPTNFISFAKADMARASKLIDDLSKTGIRVEPIGLPERLNVRDVILILISPASMTSEANYAPLPLERLKAFHSIVPVCIAGESIPEKPFKGLDTVVDMRTDYEMGLRQLIPILLLDGGLIDDTSSPGNAPKTIRSSPKLIVEVVYATNRKAITIKDGENTYGAELAKQLTFGLCKVSVPEAHRVGKLELPSLLRLQFRSDPVKHFTVLHSETLPNEKLDDILFGKSSAERDTLLYIHGYNVDFNQAVLRTGQLKWDLQTPMILYSWPSQGKVTGYLNDTTQIERSGPNLQSLILRLNRSLGNALHLWADGLGAQALLDALSALERQDFRVGQVILTNPDVDRDVFVRHAEGIAKIAERMTVYVGANDLVLKASEQMHGLPRSGRSILGLPSVDTIETSDSEFGSLLADIHALLKQRLPPEKRFGLLQTRSEQGIYWVIRARPPFA